MDSFALLLLACPRFSRGPVINNHPSSGTHSRMHACSLADELHLNVTPLPNVIFHFFVSFCGSPRARGPEPKYTGTFSEVRPYENTNQSD